MCFMSQSASNSQPHWCYFSNILNVYCNEKLKECSLPLILHTLTYRDKCIGQTVTQNESPPCSWCRQWKDAHQELHMKHQARSCCSANTREFGRLMIANNKHHSYLPLIQGFQSVDQKQFPKKMHHFHLFEQKIGSCPPLFLNGYTKLVLELTKSYPNWNQQNYWILPKGEYARRAITKYESGKFCEKSEQITRSNPNHWFVAVTEFRGSAPAFCSAQGDSTLAMSFVISRNSRDSLGNEYSFHLGRTYFVEQHT